MEDHKRLEATKQPQQQQQQSPSSNNGPLRSSIAAQQQQQQQQPQQQQTSPLSAIPTPHYIPKAAPEAINPKRPRYGINQWKLLPPPNQQPPLAVGAADTNNGSSPSPPSSSTASSPSQDPNKPLHIEQPQPFQLRKGKYVSPIGKPNEMLWLARAWRAQYDRKTVSSAAGRGKTRAEKDREVAEFLKSRGVNRDAKTAGTKWDNMLGEFRKVCEWEVGGGIGKSYFRLSPYEGKIHRLPASFDEEVYDALSTFMGLRRSPAKIAAAAPQCRGAAAADGDDGLNSPDTMKSLTLPLPPPPSKDDFDGMNVMRSITDFLKDNYSEST